jgi:hypothetical protein
MIDLSRAPKTLRTNASKPWRSSGPKLWRIRGKARDGLVVTLGRYETEPEAQTDLLRLADYGGYRNLELQAIIPPPPSAAPAPFIRGRRPATRAG